MKKFKNDGAFVCFVDFFLRGVWESSRKVYKMTRKDQDIGFFINLEHVLSHHRFTFWLRKLNNSLSGQQRMSKSSKVSRSVRVPWGKQQGGIRRFQNHAQDWGSESQGKPCWLSGNLEVKESQGARKPRAPKWESGLSSALREELQLTSEGGNDKELPSRWTSTPLLPKTDDGCIFFPTSQNSGRHLSWGIVTGTGWQRTVGRFFFSLPRGEGMEVAQSARTAQQLLLLSDKVALERKAELRAGGGQP